MSIPIHISLDIETWGKKPGCDIRSIGACVFDPHTGLVAESSSSLCFYTACDNPLVYISGDPSNGDSYGPKYNLERDPQTVKWWSEQSKEAQAAFDNPIDLKESLSNLSFWFTSLGNKQDFRIWPHRAGYDLPILEAAYDATYLPVPWHYRAPRDKRTAFDMVGIDNHTGWLASHNQGELHHALHDARSQAKAIYSVYTKLKEMTICP